MRIHPALLRSSLLGLLLALPGSGLASFAQSSNPVIPSVVEVDDNASFPAFLDYLASSVGQSPGLDFEARIPVELRDGEGRGVPFATWKLSAGSGMAVGGRATADGRFSIFKKAAGIPVGRATRLEVSARGSARVVDVPANPSLPLQVSLDSPRFPASPLPLDIVFVLDSTVSMAKAFPGIKQTITMARFSALSLGLDLKPRFALVLFKDRGESFLTQVTSLADDEGKFTKALTAAQAKSGGDAREAVGAGLAAALEETGFAEDGLRLVFLFTDAAPKPGEEGPHSSGLPEAVKAAAVAGVKVFTVGLEGIPGEGERALREAAAYTGGHYLSVPLPSRAATTKPSSYVRGNLAEFIVRIIVGEAKAATGSGMGKAAEPALVILDEVSRRMASSLAYPEAARLRALAGTVRVELDVGKDGGLLSASVGESSGSAILDKAALALAAAAFPMPNPAAVTAHLSMAVTYSLR
ncbi:MAG: TonB family protein [Spirochaetota bacterium]